MLTPSHGGDRTAFAALTGLTPRSLTDFSVNVRPEGPPDFLQAALIRSMEDLAAYPDPHGETARLAIARKLGLDRACVLPGNGSNALIHTLLPVLREQLERKQRTPDVHILEPAFSEYAKAAKGFAIHHHLAGADLLPAFGALTGVRHGVVFAANPGNPSGIFVEPHEWCSLFTSRPDLFFVLDEAFIDYVGEAGSVIPLLRNNWPDNVVVLRSLTKFYAVPGLRMGYVVGPATLIDAVQTATPEWSMNSMALAAMCTVMESPLALADASATRKANQQAREHLSGCLSAITGVRVMPSAANYVLFQVGTPALLGTNDLAFRLAKDHGLILRDCANYHGLEPAAEHSWYRAAVRTTGDHLRLTEALRTALFPSSAAKTVTRRTPALMIQGATSDAGKSVLAAAFCRIFQQEGFRVAPFKAQNMSRYGGSAGTDAAGNPLEISRAQITQAQAARQTPDVRMNPVMLKPCTQTGSEVMVLGQSTRHMEAREYLTARQHLWPAITGAYDELAAENDIMVLEGAGSPAEINLKHADVVNMAMAKHARARVILAGDIDRGGLYAALLGTVMTFTPEERALLLGFAINRFRGDASLLGPANDWLFAHTGAPVLGVVHYIPNLGLPEEDSLSGIGNTALTMTFADVDTALDRLAEVVRQSFDTASLYRALGL